VGKISRVGGDLNDFTNIPGFPQTSDLRSRETRASHGHLGKTEPNTGFLLCLMRLPLLEPLLEIIEKFA
jgi:hypothetical protein